MNFLEPVVDICTDDYAPVWNIVGIVINTIMIGVPILLIVLGMIDFAKAVIANKEDEQKKATKLLVKRFLYAIGVFASVWIVTAVLSLVSGVFSKQDDFQYDEAAWKRCWSLIKNGSTGTSTSNNNSSNSNNEQKKCYKCTYSIGPFYKYVLPKNAGNCDEQSQFTTENSCLANNKGACYLCGEENIDGMPPYYEWRDAPVAGCRRTNKSMEDCEGAINSTNRFKTNRIK